MYGAAEFPWEDLPASSEESEEGTVSGFDCVAQASRRHSFASRWGRWPAARQVPPRRGTVSRGVRPPLHRWHPGVTHAGADDLFALKAQLEGRFSRLVNASRRSRVASKDAWLHSAWRTQSWASRALRVQQWVVYDTKREELEVLMARHWLPQGEFDRPGCTVVARNGSQLTYECEGRKYSVWRR